jgi:undecaprenyl-diphosphatase
MSHATAFDEGVVLYVNQFSRKSWMFDQLVAFLSSNNLLKGGVFMTLIWWAWFRRGQRSESAPAPERLHIMATLLGCVAALALARVLALMLPFRPRPLHEKTLELVLPYGMAPTLLDGFSSFPSDHAVLFFTLATGLVFVSRKLGAAALAYATVCIALPRIYLGLHYPTDIAAGAALGVAVGWSANRSLSASRPMAAVTALLDWSRAKPGVFYPVFFLMTYQIADMFDSSRHLVVGVVKVFQWFWA